MSGSYLDACAQRTLDLYEPDPRLYRAAAAAAFVQHLELRSQSRFRRGELSHWALRLFDAGAASIAAGLQPTCARLVPVGEDTWELRNADAGCLVSGQGEFAQLQAQLGASVRSSLERLVGSAAGHRTYVQRIVARIAAVLIDHVDEARRCARRLL